MESLSVLSRKLQTIDPEIVRASAAFLLMICVGTIVYAFAEGWSFVDAAYFSVITLTTIGYGDIHPTMTFTKLFTIVYVLIGVGLVFYLFTSLAHHLFEDEKKEIRHIEEEIEALEALLKKKHP